MRRGTLNVAELILEAMTASCTTLDIPIAILYAARLRPPNYGNAQHGKRQQ
jgi:hypothetical protein